MQRFCNFGKNAAQAAMAMQRRATLDNAAQLMQCSPLAMDRRNASYFLKSTHCTTLN
jgi:hypothetical protein